jgi:hypothetical protein
MVPAPSELPPAFLLINKFYHMESFEIQPQSFLPEVPTGKFWICLPGLLTSGRYILDNLGFVCLTH